MEKRHLIGGQVKTPFMALDTLLMRWPDLNPIENVWCSMKTFLCKEYKPKNLNKLKQGIYTFWRQITPKVCQKYIYHLQRVTEGDA